MKTSLSALSYFAYAELTHKDYKTFNQLYIKTPNRDAFYITFKTVKHKTIKKKNKEKENICTFIEKATTLRCHKRNTRKGLRRGVNV